ncbi:MAG: aspartate aminotransferase family protein [Acidobacteriota bacterium]
MSAFSGDLRDDDALRQRDRRRLGRGDRLPSMTSDGLGGAASQRLWQQLARCEAPGINTLDPSSGTGLPPWRAARGANVIDVDGNRHIDLTAGFGVAAVGHRHPRVVDAVRRQAGHLLHGLGDAAAHPLRARLAARLVVRAPVDDAIVYPAVSGADAIEIAHKTACLATGRPGLVTFDTGYHGLTFGALRATARADFRAPFGALLAEDLVHRLPFGADPAAIDARIAAAAPAVGAVLVEPIVGREGVRLPPPGWLAAVAAVARRRGALLIADEIFTGFGRTGAWFAVEHDDVRPDLLCCGKAVAGGLPIGLVLGRRAVMDAWTHPGEARHTGTFVAHPLAWAAALATLDVLENDDLPDRARRLGDALAPRLADWPRRFAAVAAVRGRGLLWGIAITSRTAARDLAGRLARRGVLMLAGGADGRVAQIAPPLTIHPRQLDFALDAIEAALADGSEAAAVSEEDGR